NCTKTVLNLFLVPLLAVCLWDAGCGKKKNDEAIKDGQKEACVPSDTVTCPEPPPPPPPPQSFTFYKDEDGDGYGTGEPVTGETIPSGYAEKAEDCNDADKEINPGSQIPENLDGMKDFNCDGVYYWLAQKKVITPASDTDFTSMYSFIRDEVPLITYSWDAEQQQITMKHYETAGSDPVFVAQNKYDTKGRLLTHREGKDRITTDKYEYDLNGNIKVYTRYYNSGIESKDERTYDPKGNQLTTIHYLSSGGELEPRTSTEYLFEEDGRRLTYKQHEGNLEGPTTRTDEYLCASEGWVQSYKTYEWGTGEAILLSSRTVESLEEGRKFILRQGEEGGVYPMGGWEEYLFDDAGNRLSEKYFRSDSTLSSSWEGTYSPEGDILTSGNDGYGIMTWAYTSGQRKAFTVHRSGETGPLYSEEYTYDELGRLIRLEVWSGDSTTGTLMYTEEFQDYLGIKKPITAFQDYQMTSASRQLMPSYGPDGGHPLKPPTYSFQCRTDLRERNY
ncbi:MAG: putative metal-binding motif-containing protein, partial [bacterium]|nr:putative metal-binding motif-containing protein [bacterium]